MSKEQKVQCTNCGALNTYKYNRVFNGEIVNTVYVCLSCENKFHPTPQQQNVGKMEDPFWDWYSNSGLEIVGAEDGWNGAKAYYSQQTAALLDALEKIAAFEFKGSERTIGEDIELIKQIASEAIKKVRG